MASTFIPFFPVATFHGHGHRNRSLHNQGKFRRKSNSIISAEISENPTKLVTFLGKGGSGKTTCATIAAQYYAKMGLRTCLVIHSQDPTAESLLGCKIESTPIACNENLSAVRLETTKMLLEPLKRLKKADARLNFTQGVLDGVVGEELGVLPGMDSIFSMGALERLGRFLGGYIPRPAGKTDKFDVIVYDGISTEETLRMIGAAERARWYLKYIRNLAEKTDIGRLTAPSFLKLVEESIRFNGASNTNGNTSMEIWDQADGILEKVSSAFSDSSKFSFFLAMDPSNAMSLNAALRYWGCAIQAGAHISGAFSFVHPTSPKPTKDIQEKLLPLTLAYLPFISTDSSIESDSTVSFLTDDVRRLLCESSSNLEPLVQFDEGKKSVSLFMPGFDKSEIKLYQYRGGSELLVEAGDQRRVVRLPSKIQGKVARAKFNQRKLIVTMR
ncbi:uncharacterized protein At1g26090, chloroplastic isoform X1 [Amborella trichopoda]|uniref:Anion-transporting ATPase-like domain-containing protein n=2 Tax=Amborella trichopoda TaxID=13333 RepID=W1P8W2_AMBTC|nr:uncharacterized protein At1g26090, chloroplastic isoform X1 [Amborella trichopoda]ERN04363.1 hypothetical protein AMTR_s00147p00068820 [Amborella trichopoda]|eukprot:XP_006842688.1 uncharacterized protein At1g26090, chloroplastic isoform X1 [Amborella trichopoda]